jgi:hypothetical protein
LVEAARDYRLSKLYPIALEPIMDRGPDGHGGWQPRGRSMARDVRCFAGILGKGYRNLEAGQWRVMLGALRGCRVIESGIDVGTDIN